jgi:hypothetical protein
MKQVAEDMRNSGAARRGAALNTGDFNANAILDAPLTGLKANLKMCLPL